MKTVTSCIQKMLWITYIFVIFQMVPATKTNGLRKEEIKKLEGVYYMTGCLQIQIVHIYPLETDDLEKNDFICCFYQQNGGCHAIDSTEFSTDDNGRRYVIFNLSDLQQALESLKELRNRKKHKSLPPIATFDYNETRHKKQNTIAKKLAKIQMDPVSATITDVNYQIFQCHFKQLKIQKKEAKEFTKFFKMISLLSTIIGAYSYFVRTNNVMPNSQASIFPFYPSSAPLFYYFMAIMMNLVTMLAVVSYSWLPGSYRLYKELKEIKTPAPVTETIRLVSDVISQHSISTHLHLTYKISIPMFFGMITLLWYAGFLQHNPYYYENSLSNWLAIILHSISCVSLMGLTVVTNNYKDERNEVHYLFAHRDIHIIFTRSFFRSSIVYQIIHTVCIFMDIYIFTTLNANHSSVFFPALGQMISASMTTYFYHKWQKTDIAKFEWYTVLWIILYFLASGLFVYDWK